MPCSQKVDRESRAGNLEHGGQEPTMAWAQAISHRTQNKLQTVTINQAQCDCDFIPWAKPTNSVYPSNFTMIYGISYEPSTQATVPIIAYQGQSAG